LLAWLSLDTWLITVLSITYLAILFVIAYWGQNQSSKNWRCRPWVYSLSLGVSVTSWAFYGMVGQAVNTGMWLAPIYIGTILCLVFAWPMLLKTLTIIKRQNLTSIADFIAFRYDRSPSMAAAVALVVLVGTIPYIALQLRAISVSFDLLTGTYQTGISTAFVVTIVLIIFSMLFGTRQISASKHNQGLVLAIAVSSVVKLFALTAVGLFATYFVFDGFGDLLSQQPVVESVNAPAQSIYLAIAQAVLGAITIFILPQQFHMMMIENHHPDELKSARWMYPFYLILINLFVLPIAIAGQLTFPGGSVDPDTFVLTLPLFYQQAWLGIVVYIGGLAAATSIVIVSAIVLSNMLSTEILAPTLLKLRRFNSQQAPQMSGLLLNLRRSAIAVILLLAFSFERIIGQSHLASIGLMSFVLLSQFAPATVGALYWRKGTAKGALVGLIIGSLVWLYCLLLPLVMPEARWVLDGPLNIAWLKPTGLFGLTALDSVSHGVFYSLLMNLTAYVSISLLSHRSVGEKLQAELYVAKSQSQFERQLSIDDLYNLLLRFTDQATADKLRLLANDKLFELSHDKAIEFTRLELSGVLGSASTSMVMKAASTSQDMPLEDVVSIVDEANRMFRFNRELLQSGVENIEQGICVVDADMRLVAWNQRYIQLLDYPAGFINAGKPIEELIRFNINKGIIKGCEEQAMIARRIKHMRQGDSHHFQRTMPSGVVLEIRGQAMPGGGFVSTYSDITSYIENAKALQLANQSLEKRVAQRTAQLELAKAEAEAANRSKTRFLAAASHDLMQPFNALTLFTSMLKNKVSGQELTQLANHIGDSLNVVEGLLSDLVEISRLDSGSPTIDITPFAVDELLAPLKHEFVVLSQQQGIDFSCQLSSCYVQTDGRMVRRIVQNFLSNAIHYCNDKVGNKAGLSNKILLGVRRDGERLRIEVWDNGPGIAPALQQQVFQEFERLEQTRDVPGLGLGLAIAQRMANLLGLTIGLSSELGKGTCFSVTLPRVAKQSAPVTVIGRETAIDDLQDMAVLVIDNDPLMLTAIASQLSEWGCDVTMASDLLTAQAHYEQHNQPPRFVVVDYHLDHDCNGVDVVRQLAEQQGWQLPCVICSADPSESVRQHTSDANFLFLRKPVKALALKRVIKQLLN